MTSTLTSPDALTWTLAVAPVAVLLVLVLSERVSTRLAAAGSLGLALVLAMTRFHAPIGTVGVAVAKGAWLAVWILAVVWPALLLYQVAARGGLSGLGEALPTLLRRREDRLLAMAWVLPSFVQGVAGFGTPIAVAAPILVALGWSTTRAVVYPLIGYHWAVTFGSMGSSFYMASLTSDLVGDAQTGLATRAALLLAVNALVAPVIVLAMDGGLAGLRRGARTVVVVGLPMAGTLVGVARIVPAVASLAAGAVGLVMVAVVVVWDRRREGTAEEAAAQVGAVGWPLLPYALLLVLALPVFLVPASRAWVGSNLVLAPSVPATSTGLGWQTAADVSYTPLALFGHPGSFILGATVVTILVFRSRWGWGRSEVTAAVRAWSSSLVSSSLSILLLAILALAMVDSGMIAALAGGVARIGRQAYPAVAPLVGAVGSFMTGSTTSSNALFAAMQARVAELIDVAPATLVAAQTAGGNVGNSMAPVVIVVGVSTLGGDDQVGGVLRRVVPAAVGLLVAVAVGTLLMVRLLG